MNPAVIPWTSQEDAIINRHFKSKVGSRSEQAALAAAEIAQVVGNQRSASACSQRFVKEQNKKKGKVPKPRGNKNQGNQGGQNAELALVYSPNPTHMQQPQHIHHPQPHQQQSRQVAVQPQRRQQPQGRNLPTTTNPMAVAVAEQAIQKLDPQARLRLVEKMLNGEI